MSWYAPAAGALILLAIDNTVVQAMGPWFLLYPSLAFTAAVMLPTGLLTNWLKRNIKFDFPGAAKLPGQQPGGAAVYGSPVPKPA